MTDQIIRAIVPVALKETIEGVAPAVAEALGLTIEATHMLNPEVPAYIKGLPAWDIAFSNPWHLEDVLEMPTVDSTTSQSLGYSPLAFAVRGDRAQRASQSGEEDIRQALRDAKRVGITNRGTSGDMFHALASQLGLEGLLEGKIVPLPGGGPMRALLRGEVDLVALPLSNIAPIDGVYAKIVCPPEHKVHIDLSLCLSATAHSGARELAHWLTDEAQNGVLRRFGIYRVPASATP